MENPAGWYQNEDRWTFVQNDLISTDPNADVNSLPPFTYWWEKGALSAQGSTSTDGKTWVADK